MSYQPRHHFLPLWALYQALSSWRTASASSLPSTPSHTPKVLLKSVPLASVVLFLATLPYFLLVSSHQSLANCFALYLVPTFVHFCPTSFLLEGSPYWQLQPNPPHPIPPSCWFNTKGKEVKGNVELDSGICSAIVTWDCLLASTCGNKMFARNNHSESKSYWGEGG